MWDNIMKVVVRMATDEKPIGYNDVVKVYEQGGENAGRLVIVQETTKYKRVVSLQLSRIIAYHQEETF